MKHICLTLLSIFIFLNPALALDTNPATVLDSSLIDKKIKQHKIEIEKFEKDLGGGDLEQSEILNIRQSLREKKEALSLLAAEVSPALSSVKADLKDLGPAPDKPADGEEPEIEPENIKKQRKALNDEVLRAEGLIKEAEALSSKSSRLLENLASMRRGQFIDHLFKAQGSIFNGLLWVDATQNSDLQLKGLIAPLNPENPINKLAFIISTLITLVLISVTFFVSRQRFKNVLSADINFLHVSRSLVFPILGAVIGLGIFYKMLHGQDFLTETNTLYVQKLLMLFVLAYISYIIFTRLYKADIIRKATKVLGYISVALYIGDSILLEAEQISGAPLELSIAQTYIVTSVFAVVLGLLSLAVIKLKNTQNTYFLPRNLFFLLSGISITIMAANIFGYAALSRYIFERAILVFIIFITALIIRTLLRPYLSKIDTFFQSKEEQAQNQERLLFFWLSLSLDVVLFFITLPLLAYLFGAEWHDIYLLGTQALTGFEVGAVTISFTHIGIAIALFLFLIFVTRLVQNVLSDKILPKTKIAYSVRQSIVQVLGYVGLIVALLAGVSAIGFDLTNLALIAGALSVGIGFGLQSIVSNFVSGLILLFERPIKVGDWIITNSGEGIVKKISVRATEIETFDRTSIIVPNSELISSSVKNWTHKDKVGRISITVGVSYSSDPHKVREILLACAANNEFSIKTPEPNVHFKDFGDSALIFNLRFFTKNIGDFFRASTQMRLDIWDACKKENIEISFPQRDLHIRTAPGLEGLLNGKK